jgi:hypothetical protein
MAGAYCMSDEAVVENAVAWAEVNGKFDRMIQSIDTVKEKQDEMAEDIGKIKEAVYNPDSGLYARLRELESWKDTSSKLIWIIITSVATLTVAAIYKSLTV